MEVGLRGFDPRLRGIGSGFRRGGFGLRSFKPSKHPAAVGYPHFSTRLRTSRAGFRIFVFVLRNFGAKLDVSR